ncbi:hypothetical protein KGF57_002075 [Candida theae]|uniref:tRNA/rRNA methyltransferase SpoU type domain-containing protein n=1 Tax=Candida theae TaxID=1198502 RepID=A0AAD5BFN9_9ASCO|nr:uncharacterized protein KGF57_002075 [Candida theae]KAI5959437.1 hypothetical protein KGF57_002075 [Candida theae]
MSAASLISKYVSHDKQSEIIDSLSRKLSDDKDDVDVLVELLHNVEINDQTLETITSYCYQHLLDGEYIDSISKLISALPKLETQVLDQVTDITKQYIDKHKADFGSTYYQLFNIHVDSKDEFEVADTELNALFALMSQIFQKQSQTSVLQLDHLLLLLLGSAEKFVSNEASNLLRWRIKVLSNGSSEFDLIWRVIFTLESSESSFQQSSAFTLWLRYLNSSKDLQKNTKYQTLLQANQYWSVLQRGLTSTIHEQRKFSVSILQLSIKSINSQLDNAFIMWDLNKTNAYLNEWARYVTLYEILAIDTSLHQAEAGFTDIAGLISPDSLIKPSWGWCLLSTGFTATIDSVRKLTTRLLLSIPLHNLYLIKDALPILEKSFLPNLMIAANMNVKVVNGKVECPFAYQLKDLITNMVKNLKQENEFQAVALSILRVCAEFKHNFAPTRILIMHGLVDGLQERKVLQYGVHDSPLLELFEIKSEGTLLETYSQTSNLRLLLNFRPNLNNFMMALKKFTKFNGFSLLHDNLSQFERYVSEIEGLEEFLEQSDDIDAKVLLLDISNQTFFLSRTEPILLAKLLESGFKKATLKSIAEELQVLVNSDEIAILESLSNADYAEFNFAVPSDDKILQLWSQIESDLQSQDLSILNNVHIKMKLFNNLYRNSTFQFEDENILVELKRNLLTNTDELTKVDKFFYKIKDRIDGEYYKSLEISFQKNPTYFPSAFKTFDSTSSSYTGNYAMVNLIQDYLDTASHVQLPTEIVDFLSELWFGVVESGRLHLSQRDLQLAIIKASLHPLVICHKEEASKLRAFCLSVLEHSATRRSLLPTLTQALVRAQLTNQEQFEKVEWLPEILVSGFLVYQQKTSYFKVVDVMADIFDKQVAHSDDSDIYQAAYGPQEVRSRVNLMAIFNSIQSREFAQSIYSYIVENESKYSLFNPVRTTDSFEEWNRLQLYTILTSLVDKLVIDFDLVLERISTEPSPLVRMYIEWILAYNSLYDDELTNKIFQELTTNMSNLKPAVATSYLRILFLMICKLNPSKEAETLTEFINIVVPGATSSKKLIRHFSLSLVVSIQNEITKKDLPIDANVRSIIANLYHSATTSDSFGQFRSGDALLWDIVEDLTLVALAGGIVLRLTDRDDIDFISEAQFSNNLSQAQTGHLRHPIGHDEKDIWAKQQLNKKKPIVTPIDSVVQSRLLQTKSGAWNAVMDTEDASNTGKDLIRSDLIVVASLVDKPPNLGGICRLSDVLGAGLLTIHDMAISKHPQFKNVAVTADQWMPMVEVTPDNVRDYLLEKKREGYTLIGLEQTDQSVELNNELKFPKKSLILLGREREGIPGDLLAELDICVEIKQVGIVRSMNIQTATAVIVHAYSTQHC